MTSCKSRSRGGWIASVATAGVAAASVLVLAAPVRAETTFVRVAPSTFNPSVGQKVAITLDAPANAQASVQVIDRDGYVLRTMATNRLARAGKHVIEWDGRDDGGAVVADEAYSFKVTVLAPDGTRSYFPAAHPPKIFSVAAAHYSRRTAALMYELPAAARVHVQAGSATWNEKTSAWDGPVLKTVVDREPRPAGRVVESWNGLDESGAVYVPDVPNFVTAILATELPENSVIAFGNRTRTFVEAAAARTGTSLFPAAHAAHPARHHEGLSTLEDLSPSLVIAPVGAEWDEERKVWVFRTGPVRLEVALAGPTAAAVAKQPGRIVVFVDYAMQFEVPLRRGRQAVRIPRDRLGRGTQLVTINWQSSRGPLAASSIRVSVDPASQRRASGTEGRHARR